MKRIISLILIIGLIAVVCLCGTFTGSKQATAADKNASAAASPAKAGAPTAQPGAKQAAPAGKDAKNPAAAALAAMQGPPPKVVVTKVAERKPVILKKYVGTFEPIEKFVTLARVSGNIEEQTFKEGDLVEKGAVLFEIEKIRYQATLEASKAKIESVKAKIESLKAQQLQVSARLSYAQNNYDRNKELYENGRTVAKDTLENSKSLLDGQTAEYKACEAQIKGAEAELQAAEADIKIVEDDLSHCTIRSEITGRAGRVNHTLGNFITPSSGPMVTIVQMDPIYFRFSISERDFTTLFGNLDSLKQNAKIKIELANGQMYNEEGEISFIDNQLQATTNTLYVWTTLKNSQEILRPGGVATMYLSKEEDVLRPAVPVSAVMFDSTTHTVYIVGPNNMVERRRVELGPIDNGWQVINSGVKAGETVVSEGTHKIMMVPGPDGKIQPVPITPDWKTPESAAPSMAAPAVNLAPASNGGAK